MLRTHCLQARYVTSVSSPVKEIDVLINALHFILLEPSSPSFKVIYQFLGIHHVSCHITIQATSFSLYPHHFTKVSFFFFFNFLHGVPTFENAITSYKIGRWPIHLFTIGPKDSNLKWF